MLKEALVQPALLSAFIIQHLELSMPQYTVVIQHTLGDDMIDTLEARRLFAASAVVTNGILTVTGTAGADVIEFEAAPGGFILHTVHTKAA